MHKHASEAIVKNTNNSISNALTSTAEIVKNYWLWIAAIYIPSITILTSLFIIHEQRRRGGSRRNLQIPG